MDAFSRTAKGTSRKKLESKNKAMRSKLPPSPPSIFSRMSALAREHKAINLGQGFPDFDCDPELKKFIKRYLDEGHNQYCPMAGTIELRTTLAKKIEFSYGKKINPETELCITAGATQALNTACLLYTSPSPRDRG